ncbi:MAG: SLOG cluster 4 domain-containing protein [Armatimonadota bacterium]
MKTMIGVMGSVAGFDTRASELSYQLGRAIAEQDCIVVTGACPGLPYDAVRGAKDAGGLTVGVSPGHNFAEHTIKYNSPWEGFDVIIYTGSGLMGREITGVRSCDIVVVAGGRSGTLGEFAIAYDEGKVIGVLQGTGGLSEHIAELVEAIHKETGAQVIYDVDPSRLITALVEINAARRQTTIPNTPECAAAACSMEDIEQAIADMELEIRRIQANIAEHRKRLEAFRDVALMGGLKG